MVLRASKAGNKLKISLLSLVLQENLNAYKQSICGLQTSPGLLWKKWKPWIGGVVTSCSPCSHQLHLPPRIVVWET